MLTLTAETLERDPGEVVRALLLSTLKDAARAARRLRSPDDPEALHDFRVALRRFRTTLRAYAPHVRSSVPRRLRRRVRALARATNSGRDLEVRLAWLEARSELLGEESREPIARLSGTLDLRKRRAYRRLLASRLEEFQRLRRDLRRRLEGYRIRIRPGSLREAPTFGSVAASLLKEAVADLAPRFRSSEVLTDEAAAHAARLSVKRLRYLLEPLEGACTEASELLAPLRQLQDLLGTYRDLEGMATHLEGDGPAEGQDERLDEALDARAEGGDNAEAGIDGALGAREPLDPEVQPLVWTAIHRVAVDERETVRQELSAAWLAGGAERLLAGIAALGARLLRRGAAPREVERKYLLRALPPSLAGAPCLEIEQGWLPGKVLDERLRRVRSADGVRHYRTVKLGSGLSRIELEDETTAELFDALWPFTAERRVTKRRHEVPQDGLLWQVDEFTDRDGLILAEVELKSETMEVELPCWLAPWVEREVTGEDAYVNLRLALPAAANQPETSSFASLEAAREEPEAALPLGASRTAPAEVPRESLAFHQP